MFANADVAAIMGFYRRYCLGGIHQTVVTDGLRDLAIVTDYGGSGRI